MKDTMIVIMSDHGESLDGASGSFRLIFCVVLSSILCVFAALRSDSAASLANRKSPRHKGYEEKTSNLRHRLIFASLTVMPGTDYHPVRSWTGGNWVARSRGSD